MSSLQEVGFECFTHSRLSAIRFKLAYFHSLKVLNKVMTKHKNSFRNFLVIFVKLRTSFVFLTHNLHSWVARGGPRAPSLLIYETRFFSSINMYIFIKCLLTVRPNESLLYFCVFVRNNTKIVGYC